MLTGGLVVGRLGSGSISVLFSQKFCYNKAILFAWGEKMLEAQLLSGLLLLMMKVLYKGVDEVIAAGFKDAAGGLQKRLYGDETKKQIKNLEALIKTVAEDKKWSGEVADLFKHEPFQKEVVANLLDIESTFDFDLIAQKLGEKFPNNAALQKQINLLMKALENKLIMHPFWGKIVSDFRALYSDEAIKTKLHELGQAASGRELVENTDYNIELAPQNVELLVAEFYGKYIKADKYVEQELHIHQPTPDYEGERIEKEQNAGLKKYLKRLISLCYSLPITAILDESGWFGEVTLKDVFIHLNTTTQIESQQQYKILERRISLFNIEAFTIQRNFSADESKQGIKTMQFPVLDAARISPAMVLLGGPGSGKSSFAKYLLANYASARLEIESPIAGLEEKLLPILINLREISSNLADLSMVGQPIEIQQKIMVELFLEHVRQFVCSEKCEAVIPLIDTAWEDGKIFLVLDGMDEVPENQRERVRNAVIALQTRVKPKRMLVTCRVRSYSGDAVLQGIPTFTLNDLSENQIHKFIDIWYKNQCAKGKLTQVEASERITNLKEAAISEKIKELSANPLLLTTMTMIHQRETELPKERVKLYQQAIDLLLLRWQKTTKNNADLDPKLMTFLEGNDLKKAIKKLAFTAHNSLKGNLERFEAIKALEEFFPDGLTSAENFLNYVDQRSGLLVGLGSAPGKPNEYGFPHRTFQEYLAGTYIEFQPDIEDELYELADKGERWSLPVHFMVEDLYHNNEALGPNQLYRLVSQINQMDATDEAKQRLVLWAGYILHVFGVESFKRQAPRIANPKDDINKLQWKLVSILGKDLHPIHWAEAGDLLSEIGDPRFYGPELACLPQEELLGFVRIPPGKFWMGSDPETDKESEKREQPIHQVDLPEYYFGRYLVTVDQFRVFAERSGYDRFDPRTLKDPGNRPVRYVTWDDALAYCNWLQTLLKDWHRALQDTQEKLAQGWRVPLPGVMAADVAVQAIYSKLQQGWRITLPSEAEWEKAARGSGKSIYPWGDSFDARKANGKEIMIGITSAVGCFPPQGEFELHDLCGNLREWTSSRYKADSHKQNNGLEDLNAGELWVLRGGAFFNFAGDLRSASRYGSSSYPSSDRIGFRIALSPFLSGR
jgi:formylglycine-generating enzyme required for sulfatase activity